MQWRYANLEDAGTLAGMNQQLIRDEGHRNRMIHAELEERMRGWLSSQEYSAALFTSDEELVAYALFRVEVDKVHLRQFLVASHRRRQGIGREAIRILRNEIWPQGRRLTVDVLVANKVG
jgi:GNAT superfamily N-acetyltransferase